MTFQKAIAVNPPSPTKFVSNKDSMGATAIPTVDTVFPPLDLIYLARYLVKKGLPPTFWSAWLRS
jgi:hypothetical protein